MLLTTPKGTVIHTTYNMISVDCPWPESGGHRKGAPDHYPTVPYQLMPVVVRAQILWKPDPMGALVFLWTTITSCERTYWLARVLGLLPVSKLYWLKDRGGQLGLGQYTRHDMEEVIVCRLGTVPVPRLQESDVVVAPVRKHSEKPSEMYELFGRMGEASGLYRRAELFARDVRPGWHVCGEGIDGKQHGVTTQGQLWKETK
uniref:Putative methyltransferase n=1 Tax=viral metagenome TaxID=1070528 RepID=A0A6M3LM06_9ZZZZ